MNIAGERKRFLSHECVKTALEPLEGMPWKLFYEKLKSMQLPEGYKIEQQGMVTYIVNESINMRHLLIGETPNPQLGLARIFWGYSFHLSLFEYFDNRNYEQAFNNIKRK